MYRKEKLVARFLSKPSDFHYYELVTLLRQFGYYEIKQGKSSGSRIKFINAEGMPIALHKPHPSGVFKPYQLKQVKDVLGL